MAYLFLMGSLLFGFPLLTAYYNVNSSFYFFVVIPYLLLSVAIALLIIMRSQITSKKLSRVEDKTFLSTSAYAQENNQSKFMAAFNSFPIYVIMILVGVSMIIYFFIRYLVVSTSPFPPPLAVNQLGQFYVVILSVSSVLVFTRAFYRLIPTLREILRQKKYTLMALITSISFAVVYMVLVNQLIVSGFNTVATDPPPGGSYPFSYAMVPGIRDPLIDLVYLPTVLVQFNPQVNLILVPFEMIFVPILSLLVASNVVMAHYLISNSSLRCSTKGTVLSTSGSILGLTASCPTCLAPTFISVVFGGITAAEAVYSNIYGVVLPPVLSVATLILSVVYLTRALKNRGLAS